MAQLQEIARHQKQPQHLQIWQDDLLLNYYEDYYKELSSKELDRDLSHELKVLSQALSKLNDTEKKALIDLIAKVFEHYIEQKIDKELDLSFKKIFKF